MNEFAIVGFIFLPIVLFCFVSWREQINATTPVKFLQYGDSFNAPNFSATLLASNSGLSGALLLVAVYGYYYGMNVFLWVMLFWVSTQIMSYFTIRWVQSLDEEFIKKRGTLHEFLALLYGNSRRMRRIAARLSVFSYIGLLTTEFVIGYGILNAFFPNGSDVLVNLTPFILMTLITILVGLYCTLAGFRGVVRTDEIQLSLVVIMMAAIAKYAGANTLFYSLISLLFLGVFIWFYLNRKPLSQKASVPESFEIGGTYILRNIYRIWPAAIGLVIVTIIWIMTAQELPDVQLSTATILNPVGGNTITFILFFVVANIFFWLAWWPAAMDQWHRVAATENAKTPQNWLVGAMGVIPVVYLGMLTLSFLILGQSVQDLVVDSSNPIGDYLQNLKANPSTLNSGIPSLAILFLVGIGLIASMISTLDSYIVVATQSWVSDLRETKKSKKRLITLNDLEMLTDEHPTFLSACRGAIALIVCAIVPLALLIVVLLTDVFSAIYLFFSGQLIIAGILAFAFFHKSRRKSQHAVKQSIRAMRFGIFYLIISTLVIMPLYEMSFHDVQLPFSWMNNPATAAFSVYINPVLAMFLTYFYALFSTPKPKVSE